MILHCFWGLALEQEERVQLGTSCQCLIFQPRQSKMPCCTQRDSPRSNSITVKNHTNFSPKRKHPESQKRTQILDHHLKGWNMYVIALFIVPRAFGPRNNEAGNNYT